jgi:hypothetical protein
VSSKQDANTTTTENAAQVNVMYNSVMLYCGRSAFGENFLIDILDRHGTDITAYNSSSAGDADKLLYDVEARDLIIAMLILKGSNNVRAVIASRNNIYLALVMMMSIPTHKLMLLLFLIL